VDNDVTYLYRIYAYDGATDRNESVAVPLLEAVTPSVGVETASAVWNNLASTGSSVKILFHPAAADADGEVTVKIYSAAGALVRTIVEGAKYSEVKDTDLPYEWDLTNGENAPVAPGLYYVHVKGAGMNDFHRVFVVR
jgi:flagellar hook assembly protein FlgD